MNNESLCSICLRSMKIKEDNKFVLYKKIYEKISQKERSYRLSRGLSSYPLYIKGYNNNVCKLKCNHYFHKKCLRLWLYRSFSCPLCRNKL